ncbi:MAG: lasso peptide biosynthesis B2 protein [Propylenella sp.]
MARSKWIPKRLFVRFAQVGHARRLLLAEATLQLGLARLALIVLPFRVIAARTGAFAAPDAPAVRAAPAVAGPEEQALAREIGWAVTRAARYLPFKAVCLPQALAARKMLARRGVGSVLHFGAARSAEKSFDAHAWLDAAGVEVTGYPVGKQFAEIACFM